MENYYQNSNQNYNPFKELKEKHPKALAANQLRIGMHVVDVCCNQIVGVAEIIALTQNTVTVKRGNFILERYLSDVGALPYENGWHSTNRLLFIDE